MSNKKKFILWFNQLGIKDVPLVGGKNASLGEMYRNLKKKKVNVPNGFAITAYAYRYLLKKAKIEKQIKDALSDLDTKDMRNLSERGKKVRQIILNAEFPKELTNAITKAYDKLCQQYGKNIDVAVRSSATAEDLPDASFAGQQETYLNIRGYESLINACKKCFASLFTNRAISYRVDKHFNHFKVFLSIGVQKMVRSDLASSGVMFTLDTESGFDKVVFVTGAYGLGENIVQGAVNPDQFYVFKETLRQGKNAIISKSLGEKKIRMIYWKGKDKFTKNINVPEKDRIKYMLNDDEILTLAKWGVIIEEHYSKKARYYKPMDIEWAKDGKTKKIFIVQARPETIHSQKNINVLEEYVLQEKGKVLLTGNSVGNKIGQGPVEILKNAKQIGTFKEGAVLVTEMTDPDWEPIMKKAAAIVTDRGGRTCHAAIVSRELGIPAVVGTNNGTRILKNNQKVTASCAEGEKGNIYAGLLKFKIARHDLKNIPKTKTKIMMNVASPEQAFEVSFIPNDGVGLAREEFIINSYIKIHPLALLNFNKLKDKALKNKIESLTKGYTKKADFFVDKLAWGVARIAAAFYPKDVILRFSDFKSNEYANLMGGKLFEPKEDNPMIGWRGASRYYSENYREAFGLECKAIKRVREEMGLANVKVMIPFCRTVEEGKNVIKEMEKHGLKRGKNNLEVYVMCEIPSNVILAEEFCKIFDGFSIGSNDLTQLTLGVDRDSALVSHVHNERNEAVKIMIMQAIKICRKNKRKIGICGQAPSDVPDFAQFLVDNRINSISLNPDTVFRTKLKIAEEEKKLRR